MSTTGASGSDQGTSTRPYLLRALHDWCTDNGFTPYIAVHVDGRVQVPMEYVKNDEIVLNVGFEATSGLQLGNEFIEFKARFGGVARDIRVPVDHVVAIYARENGQGMAFPMPAQTEPDAVAADPTPSRALRLATAEDEQEPDRDAAAPPSPVKTAKPAKPGTAPTAPTPLAAAPAPQRPGAARTPPPDEPPDSPAPGGRPSLKRVK